MLKHINPVALAAFGSAAVNVIVLALDLGDDMKTALLMLADAVILLLVGRAVTPERTLRQAGTSGREVRQIACHHEAHMVPVVEGRKLQDWERGPHD